MRFGVVKLRLEAGMLEKVGGRQLIIWTEVRIVAGPFMYCEQNIWLTRLLIVPNTFDLGTRGTSLTGLYILWRSCYSNLPTCEVDHGNLKNGTLDECDRVTFAQLSYYDKRGSIMTPFYAFPTPPASQLSISRSLPFRFFQWYQRRIRPFDSKQTNLSHTLPSLPHPKWNPSIPSSDRETSFLSPFSHSSC
jgi:hypothetical protein